jgi:hypothetical protein
MVNKGNPELGGGDPNLCRDDVSGSAPALRRNDASPCCDPVLTSKLRAPTSHDANIRTVVQ